MRGPPQVIPFTIGPERGAGRGGSLVAGIRPGGDLFSIFFSRLNSFGWKGFYWHHHRHYYVWCTFPTRFSRALGEIVGEESQIISAILFQ